MIDTDTARQARIAVRCPHCQAQIGSACVLPSSGRRLVMSAVHPSRVEALVQLRGAA